MKKLFLGLAFVILTTFLSSLAWADSVTLLWDPGTGSSPDGYNIYRSEKIEDHSTAWEKIGTAAKDITTYTDEVDNKNYAWMVTAFDTTGKESFPSNMVERYDRTPYPTVTNLKKE